MEVEYSIGVNNRFLALGLDDEDPEETLLKQEKKEEPSKKEKAKKQDKKAAKQPVKETKPAAGRKDNVNEEPKKEERTDSRRGGRGKSDVRRENDKNTRLTNGPSERRDRDDNTPRERRGGGFGGGFRRRDGPQGDTDSPDKEGAERERGVFERGRGGRGSRGGGGRGRGGFGPRGGGGFGRKREFERRSGSDRSSVKPQEKRDGGGQFNWGSPTEGASEETDVFPQTEVADWAEASPDPDAVKETTEEAQGEDKENEESKAEEAPKEMSLEEWKELQEKERAKATFELRKAGEGEKKGMWKDTKVLKKPVEEEGEYGARRVIEVKEKTSGRVKQTVDIPFDFKMNNEPRRGGRGGNRGGRGDRVGRGGRGGRGRGGGGRGGFGSRGDSNESGTNFALNNEEFPTLG